MFWLYHQSETLSKGGKVFRSICRIIVGSDPEGKERPAGEPCPSNPNAQQVSLEVQGKGVTYPLEEFIQQYERVCPTA